MICMAACLLVCSLGSLLVKRDSGSRDPTTGSWAASRLTPIMKAAGARAITIRRFFIDVPPFKYLVMYETLQASPRPLAERPSDAGRPYALREGYHFPLSLFQSRCSLIAFNILG